MNAGTMVDKILKIAKRQSDQGVIDNAWLQLRVEAARICKIFSVAALRTTVEIDFTSSDYSSGMILPSNIAGIDMIRDSDDNEFYEKNRSDIEPSEYGFRFYRDVPSTEGLVTGIDVNISYGGSSFTSATLTASSSEAKGEYVRFGEGLEYYKITTTDTPFSIEPAYYGKPLVDGDFVVRPPETNRMVILNDSETALKDRTMTIFYHKTHPGLYRPSDQILLPDTHYLFLSIIRGMPETKLRFPVSQAALKEAKADMMAMNPSFPRSPNPRDKHNKPFAFNTAMYSDRRS